MDVTTAGEVTATQSALYIGGVVGSNTATVENATAAGTVTGDGNSAGGVVGSNNGMLTASSSSSDVNGYGHAGGLVGTNDYEGVISESFATGDVNVSTGIAGGLIGTNYGEVKDTYAHGNVNGTVAGGLVGRNGATFSEVGEVTTSFATGAITGDEADPLVAQSKNSDAISKSYWDTVTTDSDSSAYAPSSNGLTTTQMQGEAATASMAALDFASIWAISETYPQLVVHTNTYPNESSPPVLVGDNPPQDLTADGLYEDIDGDGELTVSDVQAFFESYSSAAVSNNPHYFNFDGQDPVRVTVADVQELFTRLTSVTARSPH
jgi:hypothetical protein